MASSEAVSMAPLPQSADLSERERQILRLVTGSEATAEIAQGMHLTPDQLRATLDEICLKVGVSDPLHLAIWAVSDGEL